MANVILVQVYQIGRLPQPTGGITVGVDVPQISTIRPVTGPATTVNGSFVYSVINMAGTTQFPGAQYYTGLTVYQLQQLTG
jgi:hypothetical protein